MNINQLRYTRLVIYSFIVANSSAVLKTTRLVIIASRVMHM